MKISIITIGLCIFCFTASSASPSPQGDSNNPCNCRFPNSELCRNRRKEIGCSLTDTSTGKFALLFIFLSSKQTSFLTIVIIFSSAQEQWVLELVVQVSTQLNQLLVSISECPKVWWFVPFNRNGSQLVKNYDIHIFIPRFFQIRYHDSTNLYSGISFKVCLPLFF